MSIYEGSVKKPVMTTLVFVAVVIIGLFSLNNVPIDLLPDIETNTIMVLTTYEGASAADVETNVTRPLENSLNTVANLKKLTSSSRENRSLINLQFDFGEDIDVLTDDVRQKLDMVKSFLPEGATDPIIFKFSTDMIPVIILSASAEQSLPALYKILEDNVANPLARIPGVGSVSVNGAPQREVQVFVDPSKLEAYSLTIEAIGNVIRMENMNMPAGNMDIGNETYSLRVQGEFVTPAEMKRLVVGSYAGRNVYLSDVAEVRDDLEERSQEVYTNSVQGATIVVQKQSGSNTVKIANEVNRMLPELQKNLPSDVKLTQVMDTSDNIKQTISGLVDTVMYAFIFVALVVLAFLGRWRATFIIVITIPISLIAAFIYLGGTGGSLNIISLSSLSVAIGMVVDDAIVVIENITRHIERGSRPKSAAVHATNEVAISVIASTLTLLAVFFPLTMVGGQAGVMFEQLGWMVTIIMIVSTISALTLTPMLASQMLRLDAKHGKLYLKIFTPIERALDKLDDAYSRAVNWTVRNRKKTVIGVIVFFVLSMLPIGFIGTEFIPAQDNSVIAITAELPVGTRVDVTRKTAEQLYNSWKQKYPELELINYTIGQASSSNVWGSMQNNGANIISFNIRLVDIHSRERTMFAISDSMRLDLQSLPEIRRSNVLAGGGMGMMGGQSTLDLEIFGYNFEETDRIANEMKERMAKVPGLVNVNISRGDYQPELQVEFDREKLAMNGLNMSTAATYLRNRINGMTASLYREDGEEYIIRVAYSPEHRESIEALENILIFNNQGQSVRLSEVGKVVESFTPPSIERQNRQRIVKVQSTVSGTTIDKAVAEINKELSKIDMPTTVYTQIGGTYVDQQDSFADLGLLLVLITLLVFIVMASQFESLSYPFIIMLAVPFAFSGVIMAFVLTGATLNLMSFVGIIMLVGIVVKNGIVLVDYINLNRGRGLGIVQSVVQGGKARLRPVLMTTLTTILGMTPMALSNSEGAELWRSMAVTVIGGLTVSTIFTLVVVPTAYAIMAGRKTRKSRKKWRRKMLKA